MQELLEQLRAYVARAGRRACFAPSATEAKIEAVEAVLGRPLPPSYRSLLRCFNGGFISLRDPEGFHLVRGRSQLL